MEQNGIKMKHKTGVYPPLHAPKATYALLSSNYIALKRFTSIKRPAVPTGGEWAGDKIKFMKNTFNKQDTVRNKKTEKSRKEKLHNLYQKFNLQ